MSSTVLENATRDQLLQLRGYVAQGAALLDEMEPGWVERIDLDIFDIVSARWCVLGQVFGFWETGLTRLSEHIGIDWRDDWFHDRKIVRDHGFSTFVVGTVTGNWDNDMEILEELWRELILARRAG